MTPYTLQELLLQRKNAVEFGVNPAQIAAEIATLVDEESIAARLRHPSARPFDQDVD
jgi:hypothetical protein